MALSSYSPMSSAGWTTPNLHEDFAGVMTEQDAWDAPESGPAFVFVVGNGLASHWATVWVFPSGGAFVVELTAVDPKTGQRWGRSDFTMRRLEIQHAHGTGMPQALVAALALAPLVCRYMSQHMDSSSLSGEGASAGDMDSGEGASADPELVNPADVLSKLWPAEASDAVRESVIDYIQLHKYQVLNKGPIRIQDVYPIGIHYRARSLPITGKHYDMLFHNCQLFVVQLLSDGYDVDLELLPVPIGAVISGPVAVSLHFIFVLLYWSLGPWVGWILVVEIGFVAWHLRYVRQVHLGPFWNLLWHVEVFFLSLVYTSFIFSAEFDPSSPASRKVPAVVLYWDLYAAILAADTNYGFSTGKLAAWNLLMLVMAGGAAVLLQWAKGWPALDLLYVLTIPAESMMTMAACVAWCVDWMWARTTGQDLHWFEKLGRIDSQLQDATSDFVGASERERQAKLQEMHLRQQQLDKQKKQREARKKRLEKVSEFANGYGRNLSTSKLMLPVLLSALEAAAQDCRRYLLHGNLTFDSLHKLGIRLDNYGRRPRTIYHELPSVLKHDPVLAHEVSWACRQWRSQDEQDGCAYIVGSWYKLHNPWHVMRDSVPDLDWRLFLWPGRVEKQLLMKVPNSTDREEKLKEVNCRLAPCKAKFKKLDPDLFEAFRLLRLENKP